MQKLIRIKDAGICIENGKARYNLYNAKGGLYALKGCVLPSRSRSMEFYVLRSELPEDADLPGVRAAETGAPHLRSDTGTDSLLFPVGRTERLVPLPAADVYKSTMEELASVFTENTKPDEIVRHCEDVIEKSFALDYADLYLCNRAFASFDFSTARHSFSVYCLFCDVLFYIRKQDKTEHFYELFKRKGLAVNFSSGQIRKYALGALLHDIGKIRIPVAVLDKPGALTQEETALIRKHVVFGLEILDEIGEKSKEMRQMVGNHHPEYQVFPDEENSPLVQILSIVDIFDACRTVRPYKKALPFKDCIAILRQNQIKYHWNARLLDLIIEGTLKRFELRYAALNEAPA